MNDDDDDDTVFPYAGHSGASGSDASYERADREDNGGITSLRQQQTLSVLTVAGPHGLTWTELGHQYGWHHGQSTGVLSMLHKAGRIARLRDKRNRCSIYVMPDQVLGRETAAHGRRK